MLLKRRFSILRLEAWLAVILAWICLASASAQTGSVVTVNSDNALIINGRKVFPIGLSPGPPNNTTTPWGTDALQELRDAGALLVRINQTNNWNSDLINYQEAALDWAEQHGMYVWLNLRELSEFSAGDTNTAASLVNIVDTFRNHPALGLWKNYDEAWWSGISVANLSNGYYFIKSQDTNHPIVQTHAPRGTVANLQPYNVAADVLALDIYPVAVPPPSNPPITNTAISQVGDWTKVLGQVANGQKQYWLIEQIAFSGTTPPAKTLVFPTFQQSRYMAYEAIINGARGLEFFGGNIAATLNAQDLPYGWNWTFWSNTLKQVVLELGDKGQLTNALVASSSALPISMSGTVSPDIEYCVRESLPYIYILASKREGASVNVTFSGLPPDVTSGDVLYETNRTVAVSSRQFTDHFSPFDVHVYRFYTTNQGPVITSVPTNVTVAAGYDASFSVSASGNGLTYQWLRAGVPLSDGGRIAGSSSSSLNISSVTTSDATSYSVIVSNMYGAVASPPATLSLSSSMPYYEPFNYPAGSNLGGQMNASLLAWSDVGTLTAGAYVTNVSGNLSLPGVPAPIGNSIEFGSLGKSARLSLPNGMTVTSGTLYYSFLLKILDTTGLNANGIFFAGFNNTAGTQTNQPTVIGTRLYTRAVTGGFNLGVAKNSSTSSDWVWDPRTFTNNQTIFIVGSYTFNNGSSSDDVCSLWINPNSSTFGSNSPPAPSVVATTGSDIGGNEIASFVFFQRDPTEPAAMIADELRIGTTWSGVAPSPFPPVARLLTPTRLPSGAFQFIYSNSTPENASVYASTNLLNWSSIGAASQFAPGLYRFTDNAATNYPRRYYQLRLP